jgi:hypothetical protein
MRGALLVGFSMTAMGVLAGCGSSDAGSRWAAQIQRAADVTGTVPGYRISAQMALTTPGGPGHITLSGILDRRIRRGVITTRELILGHTVALTERFAGTTYYMPARAVPQMSQLTHGKPWLKIDFGAALGAIGLGSLPTSGSDPSQFVDYLRAVSSKTTRIGSATVRGASTTHYHATVDLSRYPQLVPAADRTAARRSVQTLEAGLSGHALAVDAWIDQHRLIRRINMAFGECVGTKRVHLSFTMDLFDYGPQPKPAMPSASQAYDFTPMLRSALNKVKPGCAGS